MKLGVNKLTILFIEKRKPLAYCNELKAKQAIEGEFMKKEKEEFAPSRYSLDDINTGFMIIINSKSWDRLSFKSVFQSGSPKKILLLSSRINFKKSVSLI